MTAGKCSHEDEESLVHALLVLNRCPDNDGVDKHARASMHKKPQSQTPHVDCQRNESQAVSAQCLS